MKDSKKIVRYVHGSFTDFKKETRYYCICAKIVYLCKGISTITFGHSICTPPDDYSREEAEKIARKKVDSSTRTISFPGKMISGDLLEHVIQSEADFLINHAGAIFKPYSEEEKKHAALIKTLKAAKKEIDEFNSIETR